MTKPSTTDEVPMYEVLEDCFVAPHFLRQKAIIRMTGEAAAHLKPLNKAAEAKLEEWYEKEYTVVDERGNTTMQRLNAKKRPAERAKIHQARAALVANPPAQTDADIVPPVSRELQPDLIPGEDVFGIGDQADDLPEEETDLSFDGTTEVLANPAPEKTPISSGRK